MYLKKLSKTSWFRSVALTLSIVLPLTQMAPYAEAYSPSFPDSAIATFQPPFNIPEELGYATQSSQSKNGKFIIHLQDAHGNVSAQRQLAKIVKFLHEQFHINLLLLEGAEGELSMDKARLFPDRNIREQVSRKFLESFELTGPEYYVISDNPEVEVYGLERMKNYYTNREDYFSARRFSQTGLHRVAALEGLFRNIRRETANKELRDFYRDEEISGKGEIFSMPRLAYLAKTYQEKQKNFDFKEFFPSLASLLEQENSVPIQSKKFSEEYWFLESAVKELLLKTPEERRVDEWLEKAKLLQKLFALELSSNDYQILLKDKMNYTEESFKAFLQSFRRESAWKQEYRAVFQSLPVFLKFYEGAHMRDVEMAKKTERWLRKKRQKMAIAVTGGFHTAGYTAALREAGFGCLVIQPRLSEIGESEREKYHRLAERDLSRALSRSQIVELEPIAGFGSGERYQRLLFEMESEFRKQKIYSGFGAEADSSDGQNLEEENLVNDQIGRQLVGDYTYALGRAASRRESKIDLAQSAIDLRSFDVQFDFSKPAASMAVGMLKGREIVLQFPKRISPINDPDVWVRVIPHVINPKAASGNGVYLETIIMSAKKTYYRFFFEFVPETLVLSLSNGGFAIRNYVEAVRKNEDLADYTKALRPYHAMAMSHRDQAVLDFGYIQTPDHFRNVKIYLKDVDPGAVLYVEPILKDPSNPEFGAYLRITDTSNQKSFEFELIKGPAQMANETVLQPRGYVSPKTPVKATSGEAVAQYVAAYLAGEDFEAVVDTLESFQAAPLGDQKIVFGYFEQEENGKRKRKDIYIASYFFEPGKPVDIKPIPNTSADTTVGMALEVTLDDGQILHFDMNEKEGGFFEERLEGPAKTIMDYIRVFRAEGDLTEVTKNLLEAGSTNLPILHDGEDPRIYFGRLDYDSHSRKPNRGVRADLPYEWKTPKKAKVISMLNKPGDFSKGAYLRVVNPVSGQESELDFNLTNDGFFRNRMSEKEIAVFDYARAVRDGMDLTEVTLALEPGKIFEMTPVVDGNALHFGRISSGHYLRMYSARLKAGETVKVKPVLNKSDDPSQGAFFEVIFEDSRIETFELSDKGTQFMTMDKLPGDALVHFVKEVLTGGDISRAVKGLKEFEFDLNKPEYDGRITFEKIRVKRPGAEKEGNHQVQFNSDSFRLGWKATIKPVWIDANDASQGAYFEVSLTKPGEDEVVIQFHLNPGKRGFFEEKISSSSKGVAIVEYVEALVSGNNIEAARNKLLQMGTLELEVEGIDSLGEIKLGSINGRAIKIKSPLLFLKSKARVTPALLDSEDPKSEIKLQVKTEQGNIIEFVFDLSSGNYLYKLTQKAVQEWEETSQVPAEVGIPETAVAPEIIRKKRLTPDEAHREMLERVRKRRMDPEAAAREAIEYELRELFEDNATALALRYGMDIKNILWGILGPKLGDRFNKEIIHRLIDEQILKFLDDEDATAHKRIEVLNRASEPKKKIHPAIFVPGDLPQPDISKIAARIDKKLNEEIVDEGLRAMARKQAINFIRRLEEKHFFKKYYNPQPGIDVMEQARIGIRKALEEGSNSITIDVLKEFLQEVEEAAQAQAVLYTKGLRRETHLNLYQLVAINRMEKRKKMLLADEMGLGKTLEVISTFLLSDAREMLVAAPKAALERWMTDIGQHTDLELELILLGEEPIPPALQSNKKVRIQRIQTPDDRIKYLLGPRSPPEKKRVVLVNYEFLPTFTNYRDLEYKLHPTIDLTPQFDFVALDEAHLLKKRSILTSRAIYGNEDGKGAVRARYKIPMSGTPLENGPEDLFSYLQYLSRDGVSEVERMLQALDEKQFLKLFKKIEPGRLSMLHGYIAEVMIRRLKEDVVTGLPQKVFVNVAVDPISRTMTINGEERIALPGDYRSQLNLYESARAQPVNFERRFVEKLPVIQRSNQEGDPETEISRGSALQLLRLEQTAIDPGLFDVSGDSIKYDAIVYLIRERIKQDKSILLFTNYKIVSEKLRKIVSDIFGENEVAYVDGDVVDSIGHPRRTHEVNRFQNKKARIMIATHGTLGLARELTQADTIIHVNYPWKPSTFDQAIDRAHRLDSARNYPGKILEIITLEMDLPTSIDRLKAAVIKRKRLLSEMIVEGNLTPEIMKAFKEADFDMSQAIEEGATSDVALDDYEIRVLQLFREQLGRIISTHDPVKQSALWDQVARIYLELLEHKGSFFANIASLDYLSKGSYPALKGGKKRALDLASGPSTLYRANEKKRGELEERDVRIDVVDYDISPGMLNLGVHREGGQYHGSFEGLDQVFGENEFDLVNLSYAFRYVSKPAKLIKDVHRILRDNGMFVVILPQNNVIPDRFYKALEAAGFDITVGYGEQLEARLDEYTYRDLVREYGKTFADDLARETHAKFTYLVANKKRPILTELKDEDFRMARTIPPVNPEKIRQFMVSPGRYLVVPEEGSIEGRVIYYGELIRTVTEEWSDITPEALRWQREVTALMTEISQLTYHYHEVNWLSQGKSEKLARLLKQIEEKVEEFRATVSIQKVKFTTYERMVILGGLLRALKDENTWAKWFKEIPGGNKVRAEVLGVLEGDIYVAVGASEAADQVLHPDQSGNGGKGFGIEQKAIDADIFSYAGVGDPTNRGRTSPLKITQGQPRRRKNTKIRFPFANPPSILLISQEQDYRERKKNNTADDKQWQAKAPGIQQVPGQKGSHVYRNDIQSQLRSILALPLSGSKHGEKDSLVMLKSQLNYANNVNGFGAGAYQRLSEQEKKERVYRDQVARWQEYGMLIDRKTSVLYQETREVFDLVLREYYHLDPKTFQLDILLTDEENAFIFREYKHVFITRGFMRALKKRWGRLTRGHLAALFLHEVAHYIKGGYDEAKEAEKKGREEALAKKRAWVEEVLRRQQGEKAKKPSEDRGFDEFLYNVGAFRTIEEQFAAVYDFEAEKETSPLERFMREHVFDFRQEYHANEEAVLGLGVLGMNPKEEMEVTQFLIEREREAKERSRKKWGWLWNISLLATHPRTKRQLEEEEGIVRFRHLNPDVKPQPLSKEALVELETLSKIEDELSITAPTAANVKDFVDKAQETEDSNALRHKLYLLPLTRPESDYAYLRPIQNPYDWWAKRAEADYTRVLASGLDLNLALAEAAGKEAKRMGENIEALQRSPDLDRTKDIDLLARRGEILYDAIRSRGVPPRIDFAGQDAPPTRLLVQKMEKFLLFRSFYYSARGNQLLSEILKETEEHPSAFLEFLKRGFPSPLEVGAFPVESWDKKTRIRFAQKWIKDKFALSQMERNFFSLIITNVIGGHSFKNKPEEGIRFFAELLEWIEHQVGNFSYRVIFKDAFARYLTEAVGEKSLEWMAKELSQYPIFSENPSIVEAPYKEMFIRALQDHELPEILDLLKSVMPEPGLARDGLLIFLASDPRMKNSKESILKLFSLLSSGTDKENGGLINYNHPNYWPNTKPIYEIIDSWTGSRAEESKVGKEITMVELARELVELNLHSSFSFYWALNPYGLRDLLTRARFASPAWEEVLTAWQILESQYHKDGLAEEDINDMLLSFLTFVLRRTFLDKKELEGIDDWLNKIESQFKVSKVKYSSRFLEAKKHELLGVPVFFAKEREDTNDYYQLWNGTIGDLLGLAFSSRRPDKVKLIRQMLSMMHEPYFPGQSFSEEEKGGKTAGKGKAGKVLAGAYAGKEKIDEFRKYYFRFLVEYQSGLKEASLVAVSQETGDEEKALARIQKEGYEIITAGTEIARSAEGATRSRGVSPRIAGQDARPTRSGARSDDESLNLILEVFSFASFERDRMLSEWLGENEDKRTVARIAQIIPHAKSLSLRLSLGQEAYERARKESDKAFETLLGELNLITLLFPDPSPARDQHLDELVTRHVRTEEDYSHIGDLYMRQTHATTTRKAALFHSAALEAIRDYIESDRVTPLERGLVFLWMLGIVEKPYLVEVIEQALGYRSSQVQKGVESITVYERRELIRTALLGDYGILSTHTEDGKKAKKLFIAYVFRMLMGESADLNDAEVRRFYLFFDTLFHFISPERQVKTLTALFEARLGNVGHEERMKVFVEALDYVGIKTAQYLAANTSVLSPAMRDQFLDLTSRVRPPPKGEVFPLLKDTYHYNDFSEYFQELGNLSGSASLNMAYDATLWDGTELMLLIQRQDVVQGIRGALDEAADIGTMVAELPDRYGIEISRPLIPRIRKQTLREMDNEELVRNFERLRENAVGWNQDPNEDIRIFVPRVIKEHKGKVLTKGPIVALEKAPGVTLDKAEKELGADAVLPYKKRLAKVLIKQVFGDGFFHADPHPGNIMIDHKTGTLSLIDAGIASPFSEQNRRVFLKFVSVILLATGFKAEFWGIPELTLDDIEGTLRDFIASSQPNADSPAVKKKIDALVRELMTGNLAAGLKKQSDVVYEIIKRFDHYGLELDREVFYFFRMLSLGEYLLKTLDPMEFVDEILPYLKSLKEEEKTEAKQKQREKPADEIGFKLMDRRQVLDHFFDQEAQLGVMPRLWKRWLIHPTRVRYRDAKYFMTRELNLLEDRSIELISARAPAFEPFARSNSFFQKPTFLEALLGIQRLDLENHGLEVKLEGREGLIRQELERKRRGEKPLFEFFDWEKKQYMPLIDLLLHEKDVGYLASLTEGLEDERTVLRARDKPKESGFGAAGISNQIIAFLEQFTYYVYSVSLQNRSRNVLMNHALKTVPGGAGRYFERFFTWRAKKWEMTLDEYAKFIQGGQGKFSLNQWRDEIQTISQKIWGFQFISGASQTYNFQPRELEIIRSRWREWLVEKGHRGDEHLTVRMVGVGSEPYELKSILKLWKDFLSEDAKGHPLFGQKPLREWNVKFEIYGVDVKEFLAVEELLKSRPYQDVRKNVELHWMDITDAEQVDGMWGGSPADITFIRHVMRSSASDFPETLKAFVRPDVWTPGGLMIVDKELGLILTDPKNDLGIQKLDGRDVEVFNVTWILQNRPSGFGQEQSGIFSPEISETADSEEVMLKVMEKIQTADKPLQVQLSPKTFLQRTVFLNYGFREVEVTQEEMRHQILELFKNGSVKSISESPSDDREFVVRTSSDSWALHTRATLDQNEFRSLKERKGWNIFKAARRPANASEASALEFVLAHFEIPALALGVPTRTEKKAILGALFGTKKETFDSVLLSVEEVREREEEFVRIRRKEAEEHLQEQVPLERDALEIKQPPSMSERIKSIFRPLSERSLIAPTVFLEALNEVLGNAHFELDKFTVTIGQIEKIRDFLSEWIRMGGDEKAKEIYGLLFQDPSELELVRKEFESFAKETYGRFIISEDTVLRSPEEAVETFLEAALIEASFDSKLGERQLAGFALRFLNDNYQSIYRLLKADGAPTSNDITRFFPLLFPAGLSEAEAGNVQMFYDVLGAERIQPTGLWHLPDQIIAKYSKIDLTGTEGIPELIAYLKKAPHKPVVVLAFDMLIKKFRRQAIENFKKISEQFFSQYKKRLEEWGGAAEFRKRYFTEFSLIEKKFAYLTGDESAMMDAGRDAPKVPVQITRQADNVEVNWEVKIEGFPVKDIEEFISGLSSVSEAEILRYSALQRETVTIFPWLDGDHKLLGLQDAERYARENHVVLKVGRWLYRFEEKELSVMDKTGGAVATTDDPNLRMFLLIRVHGIIQYLAKSILQKGQLSDRHLKVGLSPGPIRYRVEFYPNSLLVHLGPSLRARLNADGEVKGMQRGGPIPESDALKEQVIASGLMALALFRAEQSNSKDPILSLPTYEELLGSIPDVVSNAKAGFGSKLQPLSDQEIINWWETGFMDREKIPLPPDRYVEGQVAKTKAGEGYKVIRKHHGFVYRMVSVNDPNRGVMLTLYRKTVSSKAKRFEPWLHYQWLPQFHRPVYIDPAAWDFWDLHEGRENLVPVEGRHYETKIISHTGKKGGVSRDYHWVQIALMTKPRHREVVTISVPATVVRPVKREERNTVIVLEKDPDFGIVANVYWKKDYGENPEKRWGKEIATGMFDRNARRFRTVDLNELSVVRLLKGGEGLKPGRYMKKKISSLDSAGRGVVAIYYTEYADGQPVNKVLSPNLSPAMLKAKKLKVGDSVYVRVEEDMNHGNYLAIYKSKPDLSAKKPAPLAHYKYFRYVDVKKDLESQGKIIRVNFALLDIFSVLDPKKRKTLTPGRSIRIARTAFKPKGGYYRALLYSEFFPKRIELILPGQFGEKLTSPKILSPVEVVVKQDKDYGAYLQTRLADEVLADYWYAADSDRLKIIDLDWMRVMDWVLGRGNIYEKPIRLGDMSFEFTRKGNAKGRIVLYSGDERISIWSPNFKKKTVRFSVERDVILGPLLKAYDAEAQDRLVPVATFQKDRRSGKLVPVIEDSEGIVKKLVLERWQRVGTILRRKDISEEKLLAAAKMYVSEHISSRKDAEITVDTFSQRVNQFLNRVFEYASISGRDEFIEDLLKRSQQVLSSKSGFGATQNTEQEKIGVFSKIGLTALEMLPGWLQPLGRLLGWLLRNVIQREIVALSSSSTVPNLNKRVSRLIRLAGKLDFKIPLQILVYAFNRSPDLQLQAVSYLSNHPQADWLADLQKEIFGLLLNDNQELRLKALDIIAGKLSGITELDASIDHALLMKNLIEAIENKKMDPEIAHAKFFEAFRRWLNAPLDDIKKDWIFTESRTPRRFSVSRILAEISRFRQTEERPALINEAQWKKIEQHWEWDVLLNSEGALRLEPGALTRMKVWVALKVVKGEEITREAAQEKLKELRAEESAHSLKHHYGEESLPYVTLWGKNQTMGVEIHTYTRLYKGQSEESRKRALDILDLLLFLVDVSKNRGTFPIPHLQGAALSIVPSFEVAKPDHDAPGSLLEIQTLPAYAPSTHYETLQDIHELVSILTGGYDLFLGENPKDTEAHLEQHISVSGRKPQNHQINAIFSSAAAFNFILDGPSGTEPLPSSRPGFRFRPSKIGISRNEFADAALFHVSRDTEKQKAYDQVNIRTYRIIKALNALIRSVTPETGHEMDEMKLKPDALREFYRLFMDGLTEYGFPVEELGYTIIAPFSQIQSIQRIVWKAVEAYESVAYQKMVTGFGAGNKNPYSSEEEWIRERLERHNEEGELEKIIRDNVLKVLEKITMSGEAELGMESDNADEDSDGGISTLDEEDSRGPGILELTRPYDLDGFRDMLGDMDEDDDSADLDPKQEQTLLQAMRGAVEHVRAGSYLTAYTVITQLFHPNLEADIEYLKSKDPEGWTAFEYLFRLALGEPILEEQRRVAAENAVIDLGLLISRNNALDKLKKVLALAKKFIKKEGSAALSPNTRDIQGIYAYVNSLAKDHQEIFRIFDRYGIYDPVWQKKILDQVLKGSSGFGFVAANRSENHFRQVEEILAKQEKTLYVKGAAGFGIVEEAAKKRAFRFAFPKNLRVVLLDDETGDLAQAKRAAAAIGRALRLKREQVWIGSTLDVTAEDWLLNREIIYVGRSAIDRRFAKNVVENNEGWNAFFEMLLRGEKILAQAA